MAQSPVEDLQALATEIVSGLADWRTQHPQAPFRQIEAEVEARLARLRVALLQSAAQASAADTWADRPPAAQPHCPACQVPLEQRGLQSRELRSQHNQRVTLTRQYGTCPQCAGGFFPPR